MRDLLKNRCEKLRRSTIAFVVFVLAAAPFAHADKYELIDANPSGRILQRNYPFDFSWNLSPGVDTLELKLFRKEGAQEILIDGANLAGYRTSVREFGGTLPVGSYRWELVGFIESQATPVVTKNTRFTIEPHTPNNAEFSKLGLMLGYSQGVFASSNHNSGLSYQSSRSLYGFFFEVPVTKNWVFRGNAFAQEYNVLGEFARVSGYALDVSHVFRVMDQRLLIQPGLRISYYFVPEVQYFVDAFDEQFTLKGQTNAMTWGPSVTFSYGITQDWFAQLDLALERQWKSVGTIWGLDAPNSAYTYNMDLYLRGLWFWPFELGFRAGYKNLVVGQTGYKKYSETSISDIRFSVQLAYLFSLF